MTMKDGRHARQAYRVRVAGTWYWVDPAVPVSDIEPGDAVVVYPVAGDPVLAVLRSPPHLQSGGSLAFSSFQGERFEVPARDVAALHLATIDDEQG
jgi:hypothetical protein